MLRLHSCGRALCDASIHRYFFEFDGGKKVRPAMVMLLSRATAAHHGLPQPNATESAVFAAQCRLAEITYVAAPANNIAAVTRVWSPQGNDPYSQSIAR